MAAFTPGDCYYCAALCRGQCDVPDDDIVRITCQACGEKWHRAAGGGWCRDAFAPPPIKFETFDEYPDPSTFYKPLSFGLPNSYYSTSFSADMPHPKGPLTPMPVLQTLRSSIKEQWPW